MSSGKTKAFHYIAQSGKGLDSELLPDSGVRVFSTNLENFPGMVFITVGSLGNPDGLEPVLEMFTKRRLKWAQPLDLPQFENMLSRIPDTMARQRPSSALQRSRRRGL